MQRSLKTKLAVLILGTVLLNISSADGQGPKDWLLLSRCVLSYEYQSAPSAPQYRQRYSVTINPSRSVDFSYHIGPGSLSGEEGEREFRLTSQQYQRLLHTLASAGILEDRWQKRDHANKGASTEIVTVQEPSGKTIAISSVLETEPLVRFRDIVDSMRATVPRAAWAEIR